MVAGHAERLGCLQLHLVMSWLEVLDIPRARGEWRICTAVAPEVVFTVRRCGDIGPAWARA
jgi:hypothetical protein